MKIRYDGEGDTLSFLIRETQINHAEENGPIIVNFDESNSVVEIEILNASKVFGDFLTAFLQAKPKAKLVEVKLE